MPTKRTLSGTYIVPQDIHNQVSACIALPRVISPHSAPVMQTTAPIPLDARPHVEYLSRFDLAQVVQWLKLCQESKRILSNTETTVKFKPLPLQSVRKAEKNLHEEHCGLYPCTFCNKTFKKKGFWIQHEISLHEPQKEWICPAIGCNRRFSTGNKFKRHHKEDHGCKACIHDKDPSCIMTPPAKSAWGCGFCIAFLESWETRANHLETHFREGFKTAEWDLSNVIRGLLLRPSVNHTWKSLMVQEHGSSEQEWPPPKWPSDSFDQLLTALRYDMDDESGAEVACLTYNMLLPRKSEDGNLAPKANSPIGSNPVVETDKTIMSNDGVEYLFNTGGASYCSKSESDSAQNLYLSDDTAVETLEYTGGYLDLQLGEDTLGVDWALWPDFYEPGGTIKYTP